MNATKNPDASEFLNADTLKNIEQKRDTIKVYSQHFRTELFPDPETRAFFYEETPKLLDQICELMLKHIEIIYGNDLFEHEYAKEIEQVSVKCYAESRGLKISMDVRRDAQKRGAA